MFEGYKFGRERLLRGGFIITYEIIIDRAHVFEGCKLGNECALYISSFSFRK